MKKQAGITVRSKQIGEAELQVIIKVPTGIQMRVFVEAPEGVQLFQGIPKALKEEALKKLLLSPVGVLPVPVRARKILFWADVRLVGELVLKDRSPGTKNQPNYIEGGKRGLDELEEALEQRGLHFAMPLSRELRDAITKERAALDKEIEATEDRKQRKENRLRGIQ